VPRQPVQDRDGYGRGDGLRRRIVVNGERASVVRGYPDVLDLVADDRIRATCEGGWDAVVRALQRSPVGRYEIHDAGGRVLAWAWIEQNGDWQIRGGMNAARNFSAL
jgi:hypothetical protein